MTDRIDAFLARAGLADGPRRVLAGDMSTRRYLRAGGRIVMDADPAVAPPVEPFLDRAARLAGAGLSVPRIECADPGRGLIAMEDLGDDLLSAVAARDPGAEGRLYAAAGRVLARLQAVPADDLPDHADDMPERACWALDWYAPENLFQRARAKDAVAALMEDLPGPRVMTHRDWHAENLVWLPHRDGDARIGILDFQDAQRGPADYDLASLVRDVRRDVSPAAAEAALDAYCDASGRDRATVEAGTALCAAQRNMRIFGNFARAAVTAGKTRYLDLLPRLHALWSADLAHPALGRAAPMLRDLVPPPDADRIRALRARAAA
ncbi:aminoglycoside phosphotransferase family protein [Jannaschia sp. LMIT008]|uniref:aminoglycoside phosphotransferase family protein n=1 Tax=Jannaschia maritima TaxID=3032585 RepID=UPI002812752E|nr:phosphotransferase [Jannaschia sp. LMIT008]